MSDFGFDVKKIFLAGIGAAAVTVEKSSEIVDTLVKKGELTVEQGKVLNEELKRDFSDKVRKAASNLSGAELVEKIADRVSEMTPEERELLRKKLDEADECEKAKCEKEKKEDSPESESREEESKTDAE